MVEELGSPPLRGSSLALVAPQGAMGGLLTDGFPHTRHRAL